MKKPMKDMDEDKEKIEFEKKVECVFWPLKMEHLKALSIIKLEKVKNFIEHIVEQELSCPFCGDIEAKADEEGDKYAVSCPECLAAGPLAETEELAKILWNERLHSERKIF